MDRSTAENDVIKLPSTGESRRAEGLIPSLLNDNADLRLRYSRVISRAGPRQRGVSNLPSYRGDTRRKRRVTQRAVETCVLARTAALMHGVPATFHFLRPVSLAGVLLAFLPSDTHRMRWMHRTPGRDACRRTKTLEGCQPFERVTSAFLLPSSYRIFLLASLPPESGRDRGREISAGSLPSSRDAELFRVVNSERYDARPSFVEPALYSPPPNFLVSRILAGLSRAGKIGASCVTVADYSFQLRAAPTWPNFHPARAISLLLDWPSPNSPSRKHLSFPARSPQKRSTAIRNRRLFRVVDANSSLSFHLGPNSPWSSPIFPALRGLKAPSGGSVASDGIAANKRPGWQFRVSQLSPLLPAASQFTIKMSLSHYLAPRLALKAFDVTFHLPGTATASPKRCVD